MGIAHTGYVHLFLDLFVKIWLITSLFYFLHDSIPPSLSSCSETTLEKNCVFHCFFCNKSITVCSILNLFFVTQLAFYRNFCIQLLLKTTSVHMRKSCIVIVIFIRIFPTIINVLQGARTSYVAIASLCFICT